MTLEFHTIECLPWMESDLHSLGLKSKRSSRESLVNLVKGLRYELARETRESVVIRRRSRRCSKETRDQACSLLKGET